MATPMLKPEPTKTRARKTAAKNQNQKKQPQRGLGVAQLERLRLQERWDKLTEMPPPPNHFQFQPNFPALHFPAVVPANDAAALFGFDHQGLLLQRFGNGGVGGGGLMPVEMFPHGGGAVDPRLLIGNTVEASRELSSIPKLPPPPPSPPCVSDRRDICFKKKRVLDFNSNKTAIPFAESPPTSFDFLGLNTTSAAHGGAIPSNQHTDSGFSFNFNNQSEAEMRETHRRAVEGSGGGILMEYEFFPRKNCRGAEFEGLEMPKEELGLFAEEIVVVDHGEGSCVTTSCTDIINGGSSGSSAVDLSLKLSF